MPPIWSNLPPLGLAYLIGQLKRFKMEVSFHDYNSLAYWQMDQRLRSRWTMMDQADHTCFKTEFWKTNHDRMHKLFIDMKNRQIPYAGFSVFQHNEDLSLEAAIRLKEVYPNIQIIWGGPQIQYWLWQEKNLSFGPYSVIDHWVAGEGEWALLDILAGQASGLHRVEVFSLDEIAFPDFSCFNLKDYTRHRALPVLFSRGCVNRCRFCAECRLYERYNYHEPEACVDFLLRLKKEYDLHWITFHDSMINGDLSAFENLCRLMISSDLQLHWDAQLGIRHDMDISLMKLAKQAGFFQGFIGLESGSDDVLHRMKKPYTTHQATEFLQRLKQAELFGEISLITNYPGETESEFHATLNFIEANSGWIPKIAQINNFVPLPGTVYYHAPSEVSQGLNKIRSIIELARKHSIPYTNNYIENLNP